MRIRQAQLAGCPLAADPGVVLRVVLEVRARRHQRVVAVTEAPGMPPISLLPIGAGPLRIAHGVAVVHLALVIEHRPVRPCHGTEPKRRPRRNHRFEKLRVPPAAQVLLQQAVHAVERALGGLAENEQLLVLDGHGVAVHAQVLSKLDRVRQFEQPGPPDADLPRRRLKVVRFLDDRERGAGHPTQVRAQLLGGQPLLAIGALAHHDPVEGLTVLGQVKLRTRPARGLQRVVPLWVDADGRGLRVRLRCRHQAPGPERSQSPRADGRCGRERSSATHRQS